MLRTAELEGLINEADYDGNTPLHMAAIEMKTWIFGYLIWDVRVNRRAKIKNGETVFDFNKLIQELCIACTEVSIISCKQLLLYVN